MGAKESKAIRDRVENYNKVRELGLTKDEVYYNLLRKNAHAEDEYADKY